MFSKKEDNNLKISKIHHKRKENGKMNKFGNILGISLLLLAIGILPGSGMLDTSIDNVQVQEFQGEKAAYSNGQLVILDVTYDHNTITKAFSFFSLPSGMPSNLISPINYAQGTLYQRVQVIAKPSSKTVKYQYCMFQDKLVKEKHVCTNENLLSFTGPGTYYASQSMQSLFQYDHIQWYRSLLTQMLVVKDMNGKPVDDRYGWLGTWSGSPNFGLYYPMKVHYTAIIVPPGGGEPIWPSGGSNSVTVISPNGGENLVRGTTKTISWSSSGSPGANVKVELLKGGVLNSVISSSTPNSGSYNWAIPSAQAIGSDYKIKVTSTTNSAYTDTSNNNFAIGSSTPSIIVISPNGGEKWVKGTTKTIKWSYTGAPGSSIRIELLKGGVLSRVISYNTPIGSSGSGSYNWVIPSTQTVGSDYKIMVTSTTNSVYKDTSNNNFAIGTGFITVVSPNGGENLARGTTKTITWSSTGSTGSYVKIELFKGGVLNKVINSYTPNDGSYSWIVPSIQTIGTDYKIKVTSTSNSIYTDMSNNYFKVY